MPSMNLHPIFVHFPVAFFSIYALLEFVRFKFVTKQPYWFYVKAVLVIVGSVASGAAILTGLFFSWASQDKQALEPLVGRHEFFAFTTAGIFFIIALSYAVAWINRDFNKLLGLGKISTFILKPGVIIPLAVLGLICVTITGGIGGIMAFGPDADPFFAIVYKIMFH